MELVWRRSAHWAGLSVEVHLCPGYRFALWVCCHLSSPFFKGEACSYFQMRKQRLVRESFPRALRSTGRWSRGGLCHPQDL